MMNLNTIQGNIWSVENSKLVVTHLLKCSVCSDVGYIRCHALGEYQRRIDFAHKYRSALSLTGKI